MGNETALENCTISQVWINNTCIAFALGFYIDGTFHGKEVNASRGLLGNLSCSYWASPHCNFAEKEFRGLSLTQSKTVLQLWERSTKLKMFLLKILDTIVFYMKFDMICWSCCSVRLTLSMCLSTFGVINQRSHCNSNILTPHLPCCRLQKNTFTHREIVMRELKTIKEECDCLKQFPVFQINCIWNA